VVTLVVGAFVATAVLVGAVVSESTLADVGAERSAAPSSSPLHAC
jgi:hypothetical protein